jgi:transposase
MTRKARTWARRVAQWRASGLTSEQFCEGRDFTAGGLRHWAYRLGDRVRRRRSKPEVHLARVVRAPESVKEQELGGGAAAAGTALVVEVGQARVSVRPGFDRTALTAVLEVLAGTARDGR